MAYDSGVALRKCGPRLHKMPLFYIKLHHFQITSLFPHSTLKNLSPSWCSSCCLWSSKYGPGRSERSAHQRECPRFTPDPREHAADEEADGARAEERQVQNQQQQGLRVHADAPLRHRRRRVCGIQVPEGTQNKSELWIDQYVHRLSGFCSFFDSQIKSADDQAQKEKFTKGAKKSVEAGVYRVWMGFCLHMCIFFGQTYGATYSHAMQMYLVSVSNSHMVFLFLLCVCICTENQLNELEQRLAQTERMLNSILTQLDPLTNWWVDIIVSLHTVCSPGECTTPCSYTCGSATWSSHHCSSSSLSLFF